MKLASQWPLAAVILTAALFILDAAWIPVKAQLAQILLENAWQKTLSGAKNAKPWGWADTSPVGLLEIPRLGIRQIVLAGTSGRNLAFGPTLLGSVKSRDKVISGHRDTHFEFLQLIRSGDLVRFTSIEGMLEFKVSWLEVIDSKKQNLVLDQVNNRITLMTCYPFDAVSAGGPLRYVVTAIPVSLDVS